MNLPEGVQFVRKPSGRIYYYYTPGRNTKAAGQRVSLGSDPYDPQFWRRLRDARGRDAVAALTFDALIEAYKASPEWEHHRPTTRRDYALYLEKLSVEAGDRLVGIMTRADVYALRDSMKQTPVSANHMLSVLRSLIEWGIPRGYRADNPVIGVPKIATESSGATPWSDEGYRFVLEHAPVDLARMAFLGRATGQRASDIVRMRPVDLEPDGINVKIGKLREKLHFVPLTIAQMDMIRSWGVAPMDLFVKSTAGTRYSADHLNSRWNRWRASLDAAPIRRLKLTIHGLRATAVADRRQAGTEDGAIADELGMSPQMVARYVRFADKRASARASRDRRENARRTDLKTREPN